MNIEPNWASPPGATIARVMKTREIDPSELAEAVGLSAKQFDALLQGKFRLNESLAMSLAEHLGSTARFWLAREKDYMKELARLGDKQIMGADTWAKSMPVASMRSFGWIPAESKSASRRVDALLSFFDCKSLQDWGKRYSAGVGAVAFRTSLTFPSNGMATLVWLRAGEAQLTTLPSTRFDRDEFARILPTLKRVSAFKHPIKILERLRVACGQVGVSVTSARAPEGCRASGASWFDSSGRPVIHLSFRHLSEDHFWFTFFHEAAHVILHGKTHIDCDGVETMGADFETQEGEANAYAQEILLPSEIRERLIAGRSFSNKTIIEAARAAKVTAGVIVGQLEKAGVVQHGKLAHLKHRYRWRANSYIPDLKTN